MRFMIVGDINSESGVGQVIDEVCGPTLDYFRPKEYGSGLLGLGIVLMCRNPRLNFKRRIRFSKRESTLDIDIMLDLGQMQSADHETRRRIVLERLSEEVPAVVSKYHFKDFDERQFVRDLRAWTEGGVSLRT
jgi:hypothetical protein